MRFVSPKLATAESDALRGTGPLTKVVGWNVVHKRNAGADELREISRLVELGEYVERRQLRALVREAVDGVVEATCGAQRQHARRGLGGAYVPVQRPCRQRLSFIYAWLEH